MRLICGQNLINNQQTIYTNYQSQISQNARLTKRKLVESLEQDESHAKVNRSVIYMEANWWTETFCSIQSIPSAVFTKSKYSKYVINLTQNLMLSKGCGRDDGSVVETGHT